MPKNHTADETPGAPNGTPDPVEVATIDIDWNDQTWKVPADPDLWDFAAIEALENGRGIAFLRAVLGRRQFARFEAGNRRTARDAADLMNIITSRTGEENPGE